MRVHHVFIDLLKNKIAPTLSSWRLSVAHGIATHGNLVDHL